MADDVEIEFTAGDLGAINFGEQDFFAGELRAGKEIAEGPDHSKDPAEVADFRGGSPYLPGALGFPPNINSRRVRFLSQ